MSYKSISNDSCNKFEEEYFCIEKLKKQLKQNVNFLQSKYQFLKQRCQEINEQFCQNKINEMIMDLMEEFQEKQSNQKSNINKENQKNTLKSNDLNPIKFKTKKGNQVVYNIQNKPRFVCKCCNQEWNTTQELGGHQSKRKKLKKNSD